MQEHILPQSCCVLVQFHDSNFGGKVVMENNFLPFNASSAALNNEGNISRNVDEYNQSASMQLSGGQSMATEISLQQYLEQRQRHEFISAIASSQMVMPIGMLAIPDVGHNNILLNSGGIFRYGLAPGLTGGSLGNIFDQQNRSSLGIENSNINSLLLRMTSISQPIPENTYSSNTFVDHHLHAHGNDQLNSSESTIHNNAKVDPYAANGVLGPWSATSAGLLGNMAESSTNEAKLKIARKKPKNKPKRPLSAYNFFFKEGRQKILSEIPEEDGKISYSVSGKKQRKRKKNPHGKIGFENLAKVIGQRWQYLSPEQVAFYKDQAKNDMLRYREQMEKISTDKTSEDLE